MAELGLNKPGGPCDPNAEVPMGPVEEKVHGILEDAGVEQSVYDEVDKVVADLETKCSELREALQPLQWYADHYSGYSYRNDKDLPMQLTLGELKAAAKALKAD